MDASQRAHPLEEIGIAREVDRPRAGDHVAHGLRPARADAERGGMLGVGHPHSQRPDLHLVPVDDLVDGAEASSPQETPRTLRDDHLGAPVEPGEGGKVEMVMVDV